MSLASFISAQLSSSKWPGIRSSNNLAGSIKCHTWVSKQNNLETIHQHLVLQFENHLHQIPKHIHYRIWYRNLIGYIYVLMVRRHFVSYWLYVCQIINYQLSCQRPLSYLGWWEKKNNIVKPYILQQQISDLQKSNMWYYCNIYIYINVYRYIMMVSGVNTSGTIRIHKLTALPSSLFFSDSAYIFYLKSFPSRTCLYWPLILIHNKWMKEAVTEWV